MRNWGRIAIGAAMVAATSGADAAMVYGSFSGTVASGTDVSGYFVGAANAGQTLADATVSGTFAYDDAMPMGDGQGFAITIAGVGFSQTYSFGGVAAQTASLSVEGGSDPDYFSLSLERTDATASDGEAISLSLDGTEFLAANGIPSAFTFQNAAATNNGVLTVSRLSAGIDFSAFLSITNVTAATPVSPIPEPSGWALMIAGFGITAGVLRRRAGRRSLAIA